MKPCRFVRKRQQSRETGKADPKDFNEIGKTWKGNTLRHRNSTDLHVAGILSFRLSHKARSL